MPEDQLDATIERYNHYIVLGIVAIVVLVIAFFVIRHYRRRSASS